MFVVIFRAIAKNLDADYSKMAAELRAIALNEFHCVDFKAVTEGRDEVALSYWNTLEDIQHWKAHPLHQKAQQRGRERWYESYSVEISEIQRHYGDGGVCRGVHRDAKNAHTP